LRFRGIAANGCSSPFTFRPAPDAKQTRPCGNTNSNVLVADPTNPSFQIRGGRAKARGLEFDAQAAWRGFSVDAGYSYLDTEGEDGEPIPAVPESQASAWLQYDAAGAVDRAVGVVAAGLGVVVGPPELGVVDLRRGVAQRAASPGLQVSDGIKAAASSLLKSTCPSALRPSPTSR
jgi:hypothetical protein